MTKCVSLLPLSVSHLLYHIQVLRVLLDRLGKVPQPLMHIAEGDVDDRSGARHRSPCGGCCRPGAVIIGQLIVARLESRSVFSRQQLPIAALQAVAAGGSAVEAPTTVVEAPTAAVVATQTDPMEFPFVAYPRGTKWWLK